MATTKLSELSAHTTTDGAEELLINDGGTSKKVTIANLLHDESIDSDHYVDGSIDTAHIADDAVTADKLANAINTAIAANTAKTTNATHTGDVTGSGALTIATDAVDIAMLSATGTASSSTFLRGDNSWVTPTDTNTTYSVTDGELSEINFTSADHTKLNAIEASADVTDATNVTAAGALMDSECAGLAAVKATTGTFLSADETKLDGIEASADVTDTTNVTAAGALMDSEVTNLAAVKAFAASDYATAAQGTTADAALPKAGGTMTGDLILGDDVKIELGDASGGDLQIYHLSSDNNSYIDENGSGSLIVRGNDLILGKYTGETYIDCNIDSSVDLYHNNVKKFETTANGITVTGTAIATTDTDTSNSGTVDLDFAAKQNFVLTLTGNITSLTASNEQVGQSGFITFIQDGTGSRTVSLHGDYETAAGAGLTLTSTASATDIVPYVVVAASRILLGTPQLAFS